MILHVNFLTTTGKSLLFREYGAAKVDHDLLAGFLSAFSGFMKEISQSEIKSTVTGNSKYYYSIKQDLIVVVCSEINDSEEEIHTKIGQLIESFVAKFGDKFSEKEWDGERKKFATFLREVDKIVLGPIKISIIGFGGVGKTTLLGLIVGDEVNLEYIPTITADIADYDGFGHRDVVFWDFAGQIQFTNLWESLLKGTRIVLLVTNSTYNNVTESKSIISRLIKKYYPNALVIAIANMQDLDGRLSPKFVEKILEVETHGLVSIDPNCRTKIHGILKEKIDVINKRDGLFKLSAAAKNNAKRGEK